MATHTDPSRIRPADYAEAASMRLREASTLLAADCPAMALYLAGVAAERALRAQWPHHKPFDARHDLMQIANASAFFDVATEKRGSRAALIAQLCRLWRNSFRYMGDAKVARVLHSAGVYPHARSRSVALVKLAATESISVSRVIFATSTLPSPRESP